jgi:2-iminobutanoate/2-iminopropanoate deaminase
MISGSIADKTKQCCENVAAILEAAGSSMEKVVKVNVRKMP